MIRSMRLWFEVDSFCGRLANNTLEPERRSMRWIKWLKRFFYQRRRKHHSTITNIRYSGGYGSTLKCPLIAIRRPPDSLVDGKHSRLPKRYLKRYTAFLGTIESII
jgi:hypothetical protein